MMRRIRLFGLVIVAVFAFAVAASASAVAAENPVLSVTPVTTKGATAKVSFLQSAQTGSANVECASEASASTLTTTTTGDGKTSGTATVTFQKCKTSAGKCTNTGPEEITGTVAILLVWVGPESEEKPGILLGIGAYKGTARGTNPLLSFVCSGTLDDVEGSFIALTNRKLGEKFISQLLIAKETAGGQEDQKFTENGVEGTNSLFSNSGTGWFNSGEQIENPETYSTEVEVKKN